MARTLGVIRLSLQTDETTSPARQRDVITKFAALRGDEIVGWAEDLDVSATKYAPWERPQLGAWLERPQDWNQIMFWRLDRLVRSVSDFSRLIDLCQTHGNNLVSCTEPIDLSTPIGKAMATLIAVFAELESGTTSLRTLEARKHMRSSGRWSGGDPLYGYQTVKTDDGLRIEPDPNVVDHVREIVDRVLAGGSISAIAADFNERGIASPADYKRERAKREPKGTKWAPSTVKKILRSPTLRGYISHGGTVVRGDDGLPIIAGDNPIVSSSEWTRIQAIEDGRLSRRERTPSPLLDIAFCAKCGRKLYYWRATRQGKTYTYYKCAGISLKQCVTAALSASDLEKLLSEAFMERVGPFQRVERVWVPGNDDAEEIAVAEEAVGALVDELTSASHGPVVREALSQKLKALEHKIEELRARPSVTAHWGVHETGETFGDVWPGQTWAERRSMLMAAGIQVYAARPKNAKKDEPGSLTILIPIDVRERLQHRQDNALTNIERFESGVLAAVDNYEAVHREERSKHARRGEAPTNDEKPPSMKDGGGVLLHKAGRLRVARAAGDQRAKQARHSSQGGSAADDTPVNRLDNGSRAKGSSGCRSSRTNSALSRARPKSLSPHLLFTPNGNPYRDND